MQFASAIISAISLAAVGMGNAVDKRKSWSISCGCESQSDANVGDCQAAIDQIDVNAEVMDPGKGIGVVHQGPLASATIMYQSGNCALAIGSISNIPGPGGVGGGVTGTVISGADFKDVMTQILGGCQNPDAGLVNGCAGVGAGNAMLFQN